MTSRLCRSGSKVTVVSYRKLDSSESLEPSIVPVGGHEPSCDVDRSPFDVVLQFECEDDDVDVKKEQHGGDDTGDESDDEKHSRIGSCEDLYAQGTVHEAIARLSEMNDSSEISRTVMSLSDSHPTICPAAEGVRSLFVMTDEVALYGSIRTNLPLARGYATYFEVIYTRRGDESSSLCCGFAPPSMSLSELVGKVPHSFGVHTSGKCLVSGLWVPFLREPIKPSPDSCIGVAVHLKEVEDGCCAVYVKLFLNGRRVDETIPLARLPSGADRCRFGTDACHDGIFLSCIPRGLELFLCLSLHGGGTMGCVNLCSNHLRHLPSVFEQVKQMSFAAVSGGGDELLL